ncbi:decaprenyl-phosphate phosphoribosyltransferase [Ruminiclostridium cellulolyticum]|uniref:UbiA prenyltransferase n=1 Tax=Ruminiclostridium cellulolyticum (strain ATCC 35319 / DSM 5812 / JCM 6584 / H10) TaxID=394503 RepID=B8I325_RUMCH|nr:decaprenyl-phosphate phosphoribosyltransferase [Ruminiclostridium cellulolyticum]ACL76168.1 UbiA prenyltransferase [Ruminiclostridium cellulolyticum H10]
MEVKTKYDIICNKSENFQIFYKRKMVIMKQESSFNVINKKEKNSFIDAVICFIKLIRVRQWSKNIFVFSGILFPSGVIGLLQVIQLFIAFFLFCVISSSVYIINDIIDLEKDILHPVKRFRPIASGKIKVKFALAIFYIICPASIILSFLLNKYFGIILCIYFVINLSYSLKLKEFVFIDLLIISFGFVLRTLSGIIIVNGTNSFWFLLSIAFLSLYLGMNKRKKELLTLAEDSEKHRKNLGEYSIELINEIIPMLTACTVISYSFHTLYEVKVKYTFFTIPIVVYGVFRYQYLTDKAGYGESPEMVLLKDKPIVLALVVWGVIYISAKLLTKSF